MPQFLPMNATRTLRLLTLRRYRATRQGQLALPHGDVRRYWSKATRCRCEACKRAWRDYVKEHR